MFKFSPISGVAITGNVAQFVTLAFEGAALDLATRSVQPLTAETVFVTQHDAVNALKRKGSFNVRASIFSLDGVELNCKTYGSVFDFIRYAKVSESLSDAAKVALMAAVCKTYGIVETTDK